MNEFYPNIKGIICSYRLNIQQQQQEKIESSQNELIQT